nr:hypothetical protein [Tanacetum cinerariifolium]
ATELVAAVYNDSGRIKKDGTRATEELYEE